MSDEKTYRFEDWKKYQVHRKDREIPTWTETHMKVALEASRSSPDYETQVGCVIVDSTNTIITTGYNGFPRGIDDSLLPNTRPLKYPWMVHSEANAIANAARSGKSTKDASLFCTHFPCQTCIVLCYQSGISKFYCDFTKGTTFRTTETDEWMDHFLELTEEKFELIDVSG